MKYRTLGRCGLKVSELCFGAMTLGSNFYGIAVVNQTDANEMIHTAVEAGINFFDTADIYSFGESETVLGKALQATGSTRDKFVVATKVRGAMSDPAAAGTGDVNNTGLSRKHIVESCEASLRRLGTDYIDLYQVHGWDATTPLEESLRALDDLVRQGKVRYLGCSNWAARQLAKGLVLAGERGWERFVSLQAYYSLVARDIEHELLPLCREEGLGVMPWSPLSGGFLTGKYRRNQEATEGRRRTGSFPPIDEERGYDAVEVLQELATEHNTSVAQIALAWVLAQPGVSSIIIGANKLSQLNDNLQAVGIQLTPTELSRLAATTAPPKLYPQWMIEHQNP
ncbi:MAG: aldo/keto reductase [Blastocatellia bacterium]|nr:aldo/keto reductase [Blastocatellia bacterium]